MKTKYSHSLITFIFLILMETMAAQNPGEIIFSSAPIEPSNPSGTRNDFTAGDNIYAVAYLTDAVKKLYQNQSPDATLQVEIFIYEVVPPLYDYQQPMENQLTFAEMWLKGSIKENKYLVIDLVPDPANTTAYGGKEISYKSFGKKFEGPVAFAEALGNLSPGDHKLKIVVNCYYAPVATGEITIKGSDYSVYSTLSQQLNNAAVNAASADAEFPKAVTSDPAREAKMVAALKNSNDWKTGFIDGTDVIKTAITYDWEIRRHEISGAILHRYCIAAIAFKTKSGECAYRKMTFQEDYVGGKFQPLHYDGAGDKVNMLCEKIK
jgi:hypothetical protein